MKTVISLIICLLVQNTILSQSKNDTIFYQNNQIKALKKTGNIWMFFEQRGKVLFEYDYSKDSMLQFNIFLKQLNYPDIMDTNSIAKYDIAPNLCFSHCNTKLIRVIYPQKEAEAGIEGIVVFTLKIDKFGTVNQTILKKSLTPSCDNECLKSLEVYKKCWLPALKDNRFVDSEIDFNFTFKLE
jgi:hypothetical protein